ncbi:hypothetical protein T492DRAFT_209671 [Pavlovales sp. CCMP2436]|nr:hypothetical protein T492DRAFT_209671 [Pavlovales sp. CCMP2436]
MNKLLIKLYALGLENLAEPFLTFEERFGSESWRWYGESGRGDGEEGGSGRGGNGSGGGGGSRRGRGSGTGSMATVGSFSGPGGFGSAAGQWHNFRNFQMRAHASKLWRLATGWGAEREGGAGEGAGGGAGEVGSSDEDDEGAKEAFRRALAGEGGSWQSAWVARVGPSLLSRASASSACLLSALLLSNVALFLWANMHVGVSVHVTVTTALGVALRPGCRPRDDLRKWAGGTPTHPAPNEISIVRSIQ